MITKFKLSKIGNIAYFEGKEYEIIDMSNRRHFTPRKNNKGKKLQFNYETIDKYFTRKNK